MTNEWQDLPNMVAVAKAQADGWKIEESDDYTNWRVWGGGKWSFKKYYRGRPRPPLELRIVPLYAEKEE